MCSYIYRNHSDQGISQWEVMLPCKVIFHWLSPYPEWSMDYSAINMMKQQLHINDAKPLAIIIPYSIWAMPLHLGHQLTHSKHPGANKTRTTRTPAFKEDNVKVTNLKSLPIFQILEFWKKINKRYTRHTSYNCLIRCASMKRIQRVLLKIQSGHDSVHRWTDRWTETSIPPFQLRWSEEYNYHLGKQISAKFLYKLYSQFWKLQNSGGLTSVDFFLYGSRGIT